MSVGIIAKLPVASRTVRPAALRKWVPLGKAKTIDDDEEDLGTLVDSACQLWSDLVQMRRTAPRRVATNRS